MSVVALYYHVHKYTDSKDKL